ncbi:MAG TPA: TM0106 family RecB-like putative nuclease [Candidatus Avipropionibacterium avicola]|uniref:TM0106 family RecB-like putative nuclease n=1 Tax=Candidatus Avipropionibacterium avicola TaxID=2840701 RepID=A0A9D1KLS5_9ACTN|nr:TM0106 family RecB-like putative nuclease [Candidatus Avipropionibacterium avicola]
MILLDAYAARSCAVKTHHGFDPQVHLVPGEIDEALQELFDLGEQFEAEVASRLLQQLPGTVDLREFDAAEAEERLRAAVAEGAPAILGASLPMDPEGHRVGRVDLLVRGPDRPDGRPGYGPVEIKRHRVLERRRAGMAAPAAWIAPLNEPARAVEVAERRFRFGSREADLVQLAHYWRMLEAAGLGAQGRPWVGVIGNDPLPDPVITWVRLDRPVSRTFSRTAEVGWTKRSILERYDHEFAFRLDVARVAARQGEPDAPAPLVTPIRVDECRRCPWWELCREEMGEDDLSVKLDKGPLDVREISVLRRMGVRTVADLANVSLDELLPTYLAEVRHRDNAEARIRTAHRRSVMMRDGVLLDRTTSGPIAFTSAEVEIDFDLESSQEQRIYLWGFLVNDTHGSRYVSFAGWEDLDEAGELALADRALGWLRAMIDEHGATVHHYSGYEIAQLERLATAGSTLAADMLTPANRAHFIDLYEIVKRHWFGVNGLGLKQVAVHGAGFAWRDDDPNGLSSQAWFHDAVHAARLDERDAARHRVLDYNEDDVIATREVRRWLREQG